ncbi:MAG: hypothetical protein WCP20_07710 [Desulfuromonadales bacterium]
MSQQNDIHSSIRKGRTGIAAKILMVATLALITGLVIVGGAALYLEKSALLGLQQENSLTSVNIMGDGIKSAMLLDDMKMVDAYTKEVIENKRVLALSVYNEKGEERGSHAKGDHLVTTVRKVRSAEAMRKGIILSLQ